MNTQTYVHGFAVSLIGIILFSTLSYASSSARISLQGYVPATTTFDISTLKSVSIDQVKQLKNESMTISSNNTNASYKIEMISESTGRHHSQAQVIDLNERQVNLKSLIEDHFNTSTKHGHKVSINLVSLN